MDFSPRVNENNPDPRIACVLLLDTSASMSGAPIRELNEGFAVFCEAIKKDELARKRAEIAVVSFGGGARIEVPFTEGRNLEPVKLRASGDTPMGAALTLGLEQLQMQKQAYRKAGLEYYRPWMFVFTDGEPTDEAFFEAAAHVSQVESAKGLSVFAIGVGEGANLERLTALSRRRAPVRLKGLQFEEFFQWLSASLSSASASGAYGASDSGVSSAEAIEQIKLPPPGWAEV